MIISSAPDRNFLESPPSPVELIQYQLADCSLEEAIFRNHCFKAICAARVRQCWAAGVRGSSFRNLTISPNNQSRRQVSLIFRSLAIGGFRAMKPAQPISSGIVL